jgi:quinol monooxygenase YgiN
VIARVLAAVSHTVKDYAAWLPVYDGFESTRAKAGVTGAEVFRDPGNPNKLTIIHRFETTSAANAFLSDPALKAAMDKGWGDRRARDNRRHQAVTNIPAKRQRP